MIRFPRISFRQILLFGFVSVAGLLAAASIGGLLTLERLADHGRETVLESTRMSAAVRQLGERSVGLERAARQYLVLEDRSLRQRFEADADECERLLELLRGHEVDAQQLQSWQARLDDIRRLLDEPAKGSTRHRREQVLAAHFSELSTLSASLADGVRRQVQASNGTLQGQLEAARVQVGKQVLGALGLAAAITLAIGLWLTRPLRRLEQAIVGLGQNQLAAPIDVRGPADLQALGRRLDWLRLRLAELDADKARFLRHVSHELKTPLAALREGVALLEDEVAGTLNAKQREVARILRDNTALLQRQIEDLLGFNAAAFAAGHLERQPTELGALIAAVIDGQRLQWQGRELAVSVDGGPLEAEVDPARLGVALGNLLSNAIRFAPVHGRIRFALSRQRRQLCIDLQDDGPGIAPADRGHVFEPFYRGERQPQDGLRGTGIGLSIVKEYIAAHGGQVELLPSESGAHFRISLPCADTPAPTAIAA
ncbi:ATP-binding protein [Paucibacter sp. R3-3]|uniref:histidine kinase n=1 Tax=Roseateles agri TaxID=3098619 RepID=A0ABU5DQ44_9BURK|nr:ATP-binding protein [Paucibacter sp. R3-3]MDY0748444.1 ATP-binding protein [Paucibacter sp. R3-3]